MSRSPRGKRSAGQRGTDAGLRPESPTPVQGSAEAASKPDTRSPQAKFADEIRLSGQRETIEAFVVAFILALLFRAFIAEAFVIPTGSMAPTLMGANKDIFCDRCGHEFRFGASVENRGNRMDEVVVGGICPNCRRVNSLDLANDPDAATFSGDRILVSKFAYAIHEPERWDVIVFKFPGNPKQNYIKRLVGLPNETLTLQAGDVYVKPTGSNETPSILRKAPETLLAMSQLVYDTNYQSPELIAANYPSRWQPWQEKATQPPADSWQVQRNPDGIVAKVQTSDPNQFYWLRYFHRWPSPQQWQNADAGQSLAKVNPYSSRAITDFYAYDSYIKVNSHAVYSEKPGAAGGSLISRLFSSDSGTFNVRYRSEGGIEQFRGNVSVGDAGDAIDGMHWVGDLILEADVETTAASRELMLELVEAGIKYRCLIDLTTGKASLKIVDTEPRTFEDGSGKLTISPEAVTAIRAGQRHRIRMSNCDDQLLLWVDGDVVAFDGPTTFDARKFRSAADNRPYIAVGDHPLDAAPVALAVRGGEATVHHLKVDRDKYYIATKSSIGGSLLDYDMSQNNAAIQRALATPDLWDTFSGWQARRSVEFELQEDQFFPMGDNSPASQDARCWAGTRLRYDLPISSDADAYRWADAHYVPRDLLVGKALMVFWPHPWKRPVPFTPNLKQIRLIR